MEFPLAKRELARMGKSQRLYAWRTLIAVCVIAVIVFQYYVSGQDAVSGRAMSEQVGRMLSRTAGFFQFIIVFLIVPAITAPLLANEKRDGTLGLLLLADFRGGDIILSKFCSAYGEAFYLLLGTLPIMAFASYFGGVSLPVMVFQLALLLLYAAVVSFLGLMCSLLSRHPANALFTIFAALLAWQVTAHTISWALTWKTGLMLHLGLMDLFDALHSIAPPARFWLPNVITTSVLGFIFAMTTIVLIPKRVFWQDPRPLFGPERPYGVSHRRLLRQSEAAPIISAHAAGFSSTLHTPALRFFTAAALALLVLLPGAGTTLVIMLMCYDVASSMTSAWRSGAMDDLLLTRLSETKLARDIFFFHIRRAQLYSLAICVTTIQLFALFIYVNVTPENAIRYGELAIESHYLTMSAITFLMVAAFALITLGQLYACVSVSCLVSAMGISARRQAGIALTVMILLYSLSLLMATWGKIYMTRLDFLGPHSWWPLLIFSLWNVMIFVGAGAFAHRKFVAKLGVSARGRPGVFTARAKPIHRTV